jgi:hypothetical protein
MHPVGSAVNSARNDGPELIEPAEFEISVEQGGQP